MVDSGNKTQAKREFLERLDKLCDKVDKDYKELLSLSLSLYNFTLKKHLSLEDILKKSKNHILEYKREWNKLEEFYLQHKLARKINLAECHKQLSNHDHKFTLINLTLNDIKKNKCNKCKNNLSKENSYFFFYSRKSLIKWEIDNIMKFNSWASEPTIIFCSEDCFKQTYYSKETNNNEQTKNNNQKRENKNNSSQQQTNQQPESEEYQEYLFCSECYLEINSKTYFTHKNKKDDKFCSEKCFNNFYYGKNCYNCYKKFPEWELKLLQTLLSDKLLCSSCYPEEKAKQDQFEEANKKYCQDCKVELNEFNQQSNLYFCKTCWEKATRRIREKNNLNLENEQNRTEQNRTEQNRTEQNRTEQNRTEQNRTEQNRTEQNRTEQNAGMSKGVDPNSLNTQIKNLQEEISRLENSSNPQQQNLLNLKKKELAKLENKLNQQKTEQQSEGSFEKQKVLQKNNSKLILGLGMGVLGLGLIGLLVYLIIKGKKENK